jgi:hypothetical protein
MLSHDHMRLFFTLLVRNIYEEVNLHGLLIFLRYNLIFYGFTCFFFEVVCFVCGNLSSRKINKYTMAMMHTHTNYYLYIYIKHITLLKKQY